uniref:Uncharacterized protein n=1 Tax=Spongospora subterranea TaxID=70186 RepID=A0A0H5QG92_9EUKA|eukprot:CRZ00612.1 hypothetical protein [Spongospora subterranea]
MTNAGDAQVPYTIESWTVGDRNATTLTKSMYAPHGPADNPPLVDASEEITEIRVSFPKRDSRPLTKKPAGHRRKSYSPGDSMCLEKHLRRSFTHGLKTDTKSGQSGGEELNIHKQLRKGAMMLVDHQHVARFHLQYLEQQRRHRWQKEDASSSLLYPLNMYSQTELDRHYSPYPNL